MSSNKEDRVVSYENQKPNDRSVIEKSEEEKTSEAPQTIEHKNNIAAAADPFVADPENEVELHNFVENPVILPTTDEVNLNNWDRHFFITPIVKLQLPFATEELQAPNALKSDRNWTEPTWRLWTFVGSSLVTDFSSPLRDIRIDPMAGLRLEYNFNKRIFVDGGLEYFAISNVRRPYSQTSIAYDLNYQRTITTVETHQLHYISMPLHVGYRIARRHQVSIGFGLSYMITGTNEIFQYKQTPTSNTLINHYDDKGFVAGFKDFPIHTELGYAFKLGRNKSIRCAYQFGLTDITKNDYFSSSSFDRNSRLLIDLSIKLKSK